MICESQEAVVNFLSSPSTYGGSAVQQIDTHLSHIFLVGARVYKMKRAIRYDFVDFSTLEKRKAACQKEVAINQRTAPEMYLGVTPIYCGEDGLHWHEDGQIVEWLVEMVRFPTGDQFDELLGRGHLKKSDIVKVADKIAALHLGAEVKTRLAPGGGVAGLLDQISTSLHEHDIGATRERDIARWTTLAFAEFEKRRSLLDARRRHGWVRQCHGDLHLANICLFNGEPTPFDAIEFNDEISNIDVLYDLAFLLMDLVNHNRPDLANLLLNRYLSKTRDYAGLGLLPLFQSMRAGVRAMVLNLPTQAPRSKRLAERYLDLALEYLIGVHEPALIAIGGYSGTGKSTLAYKLALEHDGRCGAAVLNSDVIRKTQAACDPEDTLGAESYSDIATERVYTQMFKDARRTLRAGASVLLDATFLNEKQRERAKRLAAIQGVPFKGLWLTAPSEVLFGRVSGRLNGVSDADAAVLERQLRTTVEPEQWRSVDASQNPSETLNVARDALLTDENVR